MKCNIIVAALMLLALSAIAQPKLNEAAPDISLPGVKGDAVSLASLNGKVVLIDFWASWCGPCRASIPGVVKLYKKYKSRGFEVFGVSIDSKKEDWLNAISKDKITYTQVNDAAGWSSPVAEKYGVYAIPNTFLLDKTGKIVAMNLDGIELENKIKELL